MKVSIVTISFNQCRYLERAMRSVLDQSYRDIEYIVVDPGSTDGSRELIEHYRPRLARAILEPDAGPADGLNKGLAAATGEVLGFLNADDMLMPEAVAGAVASLSADLGIDVVSGHALVLDANDRVLRRAHSDPFSLRAYAYGATVLIQPSTFIRAAAFRRTGGFNAANRTNWDGELFVDLALAGARFRVVDRDWSCYRIHAQSITGSARLQQQIQAYSDRMFERIVERRRQPFDRALGWMYLAAKYLRTPAALLERLRFGPVFGAARSGGD